MDIPVFFLENAADGNIFTLSEDTSRHVVQVLRMKPSKKIQLTDGAGSLLTAEIIDSHKKKCTVTIVEKQFINKKKKQTSIAISLLKNATRFEWFLEKATEIGITEIIPLLCERTEKQHFRYDRMQQIVVSAMLQSKQVWLPLLQQPISFQNVISSKKYDKRLIAHCEEDPKSSIQTFSGYESVQVLIGPEGDFTKNEIAAALQNYFQPVTLGNTRLRTETAGVVAATFLCS